MTAGATHFGRQPERSLRQQSQRRPGGHSQPGSQQRPRHQQSPLGRGGGELRNAPEPADQLHRQRSALHPAEQRQCQEQFARGQSFQPADSRQDHHSKGKPQHSGDHATLLPLSDGWRPQRSARTRARPSQELSEIRPWFYAAETGPPILDFFSLHGAPATYNKATGGRQQLAMAVSYAAPNADNAEGGDALNAGGVMGEYTSPACSRRSG